MKIIRHFFGDDPLQEELHLVHSEVRHDDGDVVPGGDVSKDVPEEGTDCGEDQLVGGEHPVPAH